MFKKELFLLVYVFFISLNAFADSEDRQAWVQINSTGKFNDNSLLFLELQPRIGEDLDRLNLMILRTAVGYQLNPEWSLWQGYAWVPAYNTSSGRNDEHRFFQQLLGTHTVGSFGLINRTRFEQRFMESPSDLSYRLRHLIRANYRIESNEQIYLSTYNEIFYNLNSVNSPALQSGIDQNRLFLGVGYQLTDLLSIEIGYLHNYLRRETNDQTNHVAFMGINHNWQ